MTGYLPPAVLWCDPGGMTGIAVIRGVRDDGMLDFVCGEFAFMEACFHVRSWCENWKDKAAIGWERYAPIPGRPQKDAHTALEPIGVMRYLATLHGCRILPEAQQHTPDKADRERLKALGWWVNSRNDAQSAAAHMLNWLLREHLLPAREARILAELRGAV